MTRPQRVLFIQGAGAGTHDEWDDKLVDSLRRELGDGYEIRYPRMPAEDHPSFAGWGPAISEAISALGDGAIVVGHSVGGTLFIQTLVELPPEVTLAAIVLIAAPFAGEGGWPGEEFEMRDDLGALLPAGASVHVFHGLADDEVPPAHADLYARAIPKAQVHRLPGRDHQLGNDLGEVATLIRTMRARPGVSRPEG
jgi:predicted alpha/beta hydrolase family esterase